jgi:hypothetical protein
MISKSSVGQATAIAAFFAAARVLTGPRHWRNIPKTINAILNEAL